jgi:hypothetical protein
MIRNSKGRVDGGKSSKRQKDYNYSVRPHPNHVKPMGNVYVDKPTYNVRAYGLGEFRVLEDEFIVDIMKYVFLIEDTFFYKIRLLDEVELCRLCRTSKAFYIVCKL